ncbi:alpha/beta-hydrolase [Aspergillus ibericus CBS 121593]|uniref:Carboxylic ester hydrolase n=1 Tax=Aspergillus ibericus CBS 121593 TaxID=1448316 RepID=A0A395GY88_9EURO|nr:alpha/beta-hydrolase [Aspergillus ibericus CBS 121593]RAL00045.1 alpha/beta-hydrolase [Aspergillus ibericus CBS 121593]
MRAIPGIALAWLCLSATIKAHSIYLPHADLGYAIHRATGYNAAGDYYNFSNIRYASPPTGDNRFRIPQSPLTDRTVIQDGTDARVCPQASPMWDTAIARDFVDHYLKGIPFNRSTDVLDYPYDPEPRDPRETEDCLFLDILVPARIMLRASDPNRGPRVPVIVWFHGGAFTTGDKSQFTGARGLIQRSMAFGDGVVFVSVNYRLGAFGWLSGPELRESGNANAGLMDQRMALLWVKQYIHFFGGDDSKVTVMGESAGAASIMHHITAFARGEELFQRAILQSPAFLPVPDFAQQDLTFRQFQSLLNVSSLDQARNLSSQALIAANAYQVARYSVYGSYIYGPTVDGNLISALPGELILQRERMWYINVMHGRNANEGLRATTPDAIHEDVYRRDLRRTFPQIQPATIDHLLRQLYPPIYNGSRGYRDAVGRASSVTADYGYQCNNYYLNEAYRGSTYAYLFDVSPGLHEDDLQYTFYDGDPSKSVNATVAWALQDYITSFAMNGVPQSKIGPEFKRYGPNRTMLDLGETGITEIRDPTDQERCRWWQLGFYY